MNITPKLVQDFWAFMHNKYGTTAKSKADAVEMKVISHILDVLKVTDKDAFLSHFVTTIGKTIYIPFTVGVPNDTWSLEGQIHVCMHEHQHVIQSQDVGETMFALRYLLDSTWRATYEGEGYRCNMTLNFWDTGMPPDVEPYLKSITNYGLDAASLAFFEQYMRMSVSSIAEGAIPDEATRVTIAWLKSHPA